MIQVLVVFVIAILATLFAASRSGVVNIDGRCISRGFCCSLELDYSIEIDGLLMGETGTRWVRLGRIQECGETRTNTNYIQVPRRMDGTRTNKEIDRHTLTMASIDCFFFSLPHMGITRPRSLAACAYRLAARVVSLSSSSWTACCALTRAASKMLLQLVSDHEAGVELVEATGASLC